MAISVYRNGADPSPYFLDNKVFLISLWLIMLLIPLNLMLKPEDKTEQSAVDDSVKSTSDTASVTSEQ